MSYRSRNLFPFGCSRCGADIPDEYDVCEACEAEAKQDDAPAGHCSQCHDNAGTFYSREEGQWVTDCCCAPLTDWAQACDDTYDRMSGK